MCACEGGGGGAEVVINQCACVHDVCQCIYPPILPFHPATPPAPAPFFPACSPEFQAGARTPDHPHSLFEGRAAELCLWADLLQPSAAGFPMFEPDI